MIGGKINPLKEIPFNLLPAVCFARTPGFFSKGIQIFDNPIFDNNYIDLLAMNHAMLYVKPGYFASMEPGGFKYISLSDYIKKGVYVEFWGNYHLMACEQQQIKDDTAALIGKVKYDWRAIVGRMLRIAGIENPLKYDCSEITGKLIQDPWHLDVGRNETPNILRQRMLKVSGASIQRIGYCIGK
jgi:hypothetical protein